MDHMRNVTLRLPDGLLKRAKVVAVEHDTSLSALLTRYLEAAVANADGYEAAKTRALARMERGFDFGTPASGYTWTRDELHDRS